MRSVFGFLLAAVLTLSFTPPARAVLTDNHPPSVAASHVEKTGDILPESPFAFTLLNGVDLKSFASPAENLFALIKNEAQSLRLSASAGEIENAPPSRSGMLNQAGMLFGMVSTGSFLSRRKPFLLAPDKGGEFGFGQGTQKEQLAEAKSQVDALNGDLNKEREAHGKAKESLTAAETARDGFKTQLDEETKAHGKTKETLKTVETERDGLKATDSTVTTKAKEQLAKNGIPPSAKDSPGNLDANAGDPVTLWETYRTSDSVTKAQMRAEHGKKLDAAAVAWDAAQKSPK